MKIYTKTGDKGQTSLLSGKRVNKNDPRLMAYGTVDELNSSLGVVIAHLNILKSQANQSAHAEEMMFWLKTIQNQLFTVGSHLACDSEKWQSQLPVISADFVESLERIIDKCETQLPKLKNFILPGGSRISAFLHVSRTVCRRAEREVVAIENSTTPEIITVYLNRLSDLLFVLARYTNFREGFPDQVWEK